MQQVKQRILIIDSQTGAQKLSAMLASAGYETQVKSTRADADAAVTTWKPGLIIANIFYRQFPTLDFLTELHRTPGTEQQKTLLLSEEPLISLVTGDRPVVSGYLPKPVDFPQLGALLKQVVEKSSPANRIPILVADDDPQSSDLIRMFLETEYYAPIFTSTGSDTIIRAAQDKPAAIIIDPLLSDSNGLEVIRSLREDQSTKNIPILVSSSLRLNEYQERGFLSGGPEMVAPELQQAFVLEMVDRLLTPLEESEAEAKPKVLIADDQIILLALMKEMLEASGFSVVTASDGNEAMAQIKRENPDIAVIDYNMPYKNAFVIAQEVKSDSIYAHMPLIILTAISDKQTKLKGLSLGIDDYLIKPVDADELVARIRMILKRTKQVLDANPLTRLPGNPSIQARIEKEIARGSKFAVLYVDLNQFKSFNDAYGFEAGDRVIKSTANLLASQARQVDGLNAFVGHIGGDDFIVVCAAHCAETLAKRIIQDFDTLAPSFYNEEDRQRGYIISTDRRGEVQQFPFLSVSIGIVHNASRKLSSLAQISQIGTELKHHAKQAGKSACVVDRRTASDP